MNEKTQTITSGVVIPLLQSAITGGLVGVCVGGGAALAGWEHPSSIGLVGGGITTLVSWFARTGEWTERVRSSLGIQEAPAPALPAAYESAVRVEYAEEEGRHMDYLDLPGGIERLIPLAQGIQQGKRFTSRVWAGNGAVYPGPVFDRLRDELISRGFARWRNPSEHKQGFELTRKGAALFRGLASLETPSPLQGSVTARRVQNRWKLASTHTHTGGMVQW